MLIEPNSHLFAYSITRDLGFAPNPFHGVCTLATCKPGIRRNAKVGDWVLGIGGANLGSVAKKCILLMKVTRKITFQQYWDDHTWALKKPLRNGSPIRMVGDNIYHRAASGGWLQEDSHHSLSDGSTNDANLQRDTKTDSVLISEFFLYFGAAAIPIDLESIGYFRIRDFKTIPLDGDNDAVRLINSVFVEHQQDINMVMSDPYQLSDSHKRVDQATGKMS